MEALFGLFPQLSTRSRDSTGSGSIGQSSTVDIQSPDFARSLTSQDAQTAQEAFDGDATDPNQDDTELAMTCEEFRDDDSMSLSDDDVPSRLKTLEIAVLHACNLPKMDTLGTCDPYCKLELGGCNYQTTIKHGTRDPVWNEFYTIPISEISGPVILTIALFDWDNPRKFQNFDKIGGQTLSADDMARILIQRPGWEETCRFPVMEGGRLVVGENKLPASVALRFRMLSNCAPPARAATGRGGRLASPAPRST